jgi:hypothetical protein
MWLTDNQAKLIAYLRLLVCIGLACMLYQMAGWFGVILAGYLALWSPDWRTSLRSDVPEKTLNPGIYHPGPHAREMQEIALRAEAERLTATGKTFDDVAQERVQIKRVTSTVAISMILLAAGMNDHSLKDRAWHGAWQDSQELF